MMIYRSAVFRTLRPARNISLWGKTCNAPRMPLEFALFSKQEATFTHICIFLLNEYRLGNFLLLQRLGKTPKLP
jgi:hypothetical protein